MVFTAFEHSQAVIPMKDSIDIPVFFMFQAHLSFVRHAYNSAQVASSTCLFLCQPQYQCLNMLGQTSIAKSPLLFIQLPKYFTEFEIMREKMPPFKIKQDSGV